MIRHPDYTRGRLAQTSARLRELVHPETIPVEELAVAGPVDRIPHEEAQCLDYRQAEPGERFGPLFATPTKPGRPAIGLEEIRRVHAAVRVPIFCIGGIKLENLAAVIAAGAQRVVIVSGLLQAPDIADYARRVKALLPRL